MALIKCVECGNEVSTTAKTCPKCGAKVTVPSIFNQPVKFDKPIGVGRWAMALVVFFLAWSVLKGLLGEKKEIPPETKAIPKATVPFKVTAQLGLNVSVLVAKGTSESDLREVVFELSCARRENRLQALGIGPTTLGGVKGPYFVVQVYVFDDPDYASAAKRNQFIESDDRKDRTFQIRYAKKIKAYYGSTGTTEDGSIGSDYDFTEKKPEAYKPPTTYKAIPLRPNPRCAAA